MAMSAAPVTHARVLQVVADALKDDGARALAILAELERPGMPAFRVRQVICSDHTEFYAEDVYVDGELQSTGRHKSLLGCLAAVVEMSRSTP